MPTETSISFKVYIMEGDGNVEVRRFEVDQGVVTNYDYIRERLQYVFPRLRGKAFKILWKDAEDDEVTISSDEEMMIALSEIKSDLCRLIIRLPSSETTNDEISFQISACPAMNEDQASNNCDSCQKPLLGARYKCIDCIQYYQCQDCEFRGCHPDHVMIRLNQNYPTIISLLPKGLHILRHLVRGSSKYLGKAAFLYGEPLRRTDTTKGNCGKHHRRGRKHSHSEKKHGTQNSETQNPECPVGPNFVSEIERLIYSFLNMCPRDTSQTEPKSQYDSKDVQMDTDESSQDETAEASGMKDGPPEPVKIDKMEENSFSGPSTRSSSSKNQNPKILEAVKLLTEMGFENEGEWLSKILQRFDGDISKALDHLMKN